MILVTGAGGKTGRAVLAALARAGATTRALVRRPEHFDVVAQVGADESVLGDLRNLDDLLRASEDISGVYHICPNVNPDEIGIGQTVIDAARQAGIGRVVLHSVLHPQTEAMPHHWNKLRVEEYLLNSGLPYTILQPAAYMQNLLAGWRSIVEEGVLRAPYPVETRLSLVDLEDVAEAAALALTQSGHEGATYELVGTTAMSQVEVASTLSEALGGPVRAEAETVEAWEARALAAGMGDWQRATLVEMFRYYERFGFEGNPNVLRWLLRREPTGVREFAKRHRLPA
jgi:uncharacterized protein YbjT (DUF2867 family)